MLGVVTLINSLVSPLSRGKVTTVRFPTQLTVLLRSFPGASLSKHILSVLYSEHIRLTAVWQSYSLRGCLAKNAEMTFGISSRIQDHSSAVTQ